MDVRMQLAVLAAGVGCAHIGLFFLYAATSCSLPRGSTDSADAANELRALVVSDIHLLGKRRRSWIERAWIDWQVTLAAYSAVRMHKPDIVLVLGDQLDEGGLPTPQTDWTEYIARFNRALASFSSLPTLYLVGNHDTAFGRHMQVAELARYERAFGAANYVEYVGDHAFVGINTMALDADVASEDVRAQATDFLESVDAAELRARTANGSVVLLTHLPLHRVDDMRCGDARTRESGHVTYEHPSFAYETHHHVLSPALSHRLLATFEPAVVLSGHTHAWCAYLDHANGAREFTVPTFSWGQRPDPSYALLGLRSRNRAAAAGPPSPLVVEAEVVQCAVPDERSVFALYVLAVAASVLLSLQHLCWSRRSSSALLSRHRRHKTALKQS